MERGAQSPSSQSSPSPQASLDSQRLASVQAPCWQILSGGHSRSASQSRQLLLIHSNPLEHSVLARQYPEMALHFPELHSSPIGQSDAFRHCWHLRWTQTSRLRQC